MKKFLTILLAAASLVAGAQIQTPQPSPAGSVSSRVGLTDIKVDYFRPRVKGRKIFGEGSEFLQPYGKIWRTGANSGTKISFSDDVKVEGTNVPKGEYLIFTWPGASEWTVSLYKDISLGGNTPGYDASKEAARFKVKADKVADKVETLTINISDISDDNLSAKIQILWENTSVKFGLTVDYDSKIMQSIEANTKVNPNNLIAAARYYYDSKRDVKQALAWTEQYFASGQHMDEFWNLTLKAELQKAVGDKTNAKITAQKALEVSRKNSNDQYAKQNEELIKSLK